MTDLQRELTAKIEALGVERDEASAAIAQGIQLETKVQYFHFFPFLSSSVYFCPFLSTSICTHESLLQQSVSIFLDISLSFVLF